MYKDPLGCHKAGVMCAIKRAVKSGTDYRLDSVFKTTSRIDLEVAYKQPVHPMFRN